MDKQEFLINDRFLVQPSLNSVTDLSGNLITKIEPRLMKLLCLLKEHERKLVSREFIVKEIWSDYGGGDYGLTQAISFLRKLLADDKKQLIETVHKSGYILNSDNQAYLTNTNRKGIRQRGYIAVALLVIVAGLFWVIELSRGKNDKPTDGSDSAPVLIIDTPEKIIDTGNSAPKAPVKTPANQAGEYTAPKANPSRNSSSKKAPRAPGT